MPATLAPGSRVLLPVAGVAAGAGAALVLLAVVSGSDAVLGAAIGLALVAGFFLGGRVPVRLSGLVPAGVSFLLLGLGYVLRLALLLVALRALRGAPWLDTDVLGVTVVVASLVWVGAQTWAYLVQNPLPRRDPLTRREARAPGGARP